MKVALKALIKTHSYFRLSISSNKSLTISSILIKAFYILFCFAFTVIVGSVVFANDSSLSPAILLLLIAFNITILLLVYRLIRKHVIFVETHLKSIIVFGLILLFVVNVIMGFILRFDPVFDLGAIFTGAKEWVTTGNFMDHMDPTCGTNYFYYFPHNLGGMTLLFVAFKVASLFGMTDYYAIAMITNALLVTMTALMAVLICRRLFGITQSVMALVCILLSPPFYFMASVFYTDSLSMIFPVLVIYLYLKYMDSTTHKHRALFTVLMGLSCGVGMLVKFTVVIALVAVIIHHMLTNRIISSLRVAAISAVCVAAVLLSFNAYFYSVHLDRASAEKLEVPYSHWIMMGLEGNGRYNPSDYEYTLSFDDKEEQKAAIINRIKERIKDRGPLGMLSLFYEKGIIIFGDGTYAQSDFLDDNPENDTALHSYILYDGEHYQAYQYLCSGVRFTLQLLMLIAAYGTLLQKKETYENMLPLLCMFGVMVFFMMWEVTGRYSTNFIPMIIITAISGLNVVEEAIREKKPAADMNLLQNKLHQPEKGKEAEG